MRGTAKASRSLRASIMPSLCVQADDWQSRYPELSVRLEFGQSSAVVESYNVLLVCTLDTTLPQAATGAWHWRVYFGANRRRECETSILP